MLDIDERGEREREREFRPTRCKDYMTFVSFFKKKKLTQYRNDWTFEHVGMKKKVSFVANISFP